MATVTEAYFDVLGLVVAVAQKGKGTEGTTSPASTMRWPIPPARHCTPSLTQPAYDEAIARRWLGNATTRHVYHFGETVDGNGQVIWGNQPAGACTIQRETARRPACSRRAKPTAGRL